MRNLSSKTIESSGHNEVKLLTLQVVQLSRFSSQKLMVTLKRNMYYVAHVRNTPYFVHKNAKKRARYFLLLNNHFNTQWAAVKR